MLRRSLFALFALSALSLSAANPAPLNLDFENGAPGEVPPGWTLPATSRGYTAAITAEKPKQGKQCAVVSGAPQASESGARVVGHLTQEIDATAYRGKRVRLRGAVRVEGEAAVAVLTMRVERPAKQVGFFDSMADRPIRSAEWAYYEITGDVAPDAVLLTVGMMLRQTGSAWLDDASIDILGKSELRSAPPREVTSRGLENLVAFTRLYGLVRHFHPSDEAAAADWHAVAVNGVDVVESAKSSAELAARLGDVFLPYAPSVRIYPSNRQPPEQAARPAVAQSIVAWEHYGWGQQSGREPYTSERKRRGVDEGAPPELYVADLGGGVSASIPLAVYADASRTLPRAERKPLPHSTAAYTGNDRATRIGAVVIAWNVFQHFYPYFDVVDVDWPAELRTALRAAGAGPGEVAFARTLRRMVAAIDDGHGAVVHPSLMGRATLPLLWRVAGDALVVTNVDAGVSGVSVGDEVVAIDGKPAMQLLAAEEALVSSATPGWRRASAINTFASGLAGTEAVLTLRGADGATRTVTMKRAVRTEPLPEKRPERIAELKPGLWYVDLTRIQDKDFQNALPKLAAAKGIVYDMRGYPRLGTRPLEHHLDGPAESQRWIIPRIRRPDREDVEWDERGRWQLEPAQPRLTKNIAYLTDGRAISYAESWMGIVEAYKLAEIVGETTAGTNGNVNMFRLPGDYTVVFTGMKVLKHDRSRHHGVGIAPTVPVSPTVAGIRAGRDEQLEKAIEVLERQPAFLTNPSSALRAPSPLAEGRRCRRRSGRRLRRAHPPGFDSAQRTAAVSAAAAAASPPPPPGRRRDGRRRSAGNVNSTSKLRPAPPTYGCQPSRPRSHRNPRPSSQKTGPPALSGARRERARHPMIRNAYRVG